MCVCVRACVRGGFLANMVTQLHVLLFAALKRLQYTISGYVTLTVTKLKLPIIKHCTEAHFTIHTDILSMCLHK